MYKLIELNESVSGIIINDAGFNMTRISQIMNIVVDNKENNDFFAEHQIKLAQNTRLDFSVNIDLMINQNSHYATLFPLPEKEKH
jgi:hypothetical protein